MAHTITFVVCLRNCTEFQPVIEGFQVKINAPKKWDTLPLLSKLAGTESLNWHPLLADFTHIGQKLGQLGFTFYKGQVTVIDPAEVQ